MKTYVHYWVLLKNWRVELRERTPKGAHVVEVVTHFPDEQHTLHTLSSTNGRAVTFNAYCGFDRGPKLQAHIRALLTA